MKQVNLWHEKAFMNPLDIYCNNETFYSNILIIYIIPIIVRMNAQFGIDLTKNYK